MYQIPVQMITDSQSLIESLNSTKQVEEKLMRPIIKWIKQCLDNKMMDETRWCDTKVCLGDVLQNRELGSLKTFWKSFSRGEC